MRLWRSGSGSYELRRVLPGKAMMVWHRLSFRRIAVALGSLVALGGAGPVTRTLAIPARDGMPAHDVRVLLWAPPKGESQSVLVYEPSWGGRADENSHLATALASAGFTVMAVDYDTAQPARFAPQMQRFKAPLDLSSEAAAARTTAEGDWRVTLFASDASVVLDLVPEAKEARSAGILGWSFGGAVAVEACRQDARFKACLNMDGWMFGPAADSPSPQPYLVLSGDPYAEQASPAHGPAASLDERDAARLRARFATVGGTYAQLPGLAHEGFSDAGDSLVVQALVTGFFAHALLGRPQVAAPPGVIMRHFPGPAA